MLPDFRFVLGAFLAIMLLAVTGLGLVTSVQLMHEAQMGPLEDSHGLAYAGHAEWNQFYDPDGARRFEGLKKTEGPLAEARIETPAETPGLAPVSAPIAPPSPVEQTAGIAPDRQEPDMAPLIAPLTSSATPQTDPPPLVETPAAATIAVPAATIAAPPAAGVPAPDVPGQSESGAPPAERIASAPPALPGADLRDGTAPTSAAQPQAGGDPPPDATPPAPRARPKPVFRKKIARAHFRRIAPASRQTVQNSGFSNAPWPGTDNQFTGATGKKSNVTTLSNRPQ